jgi:hypothetical protein
MNRRAQRERERSVRKGAGRGWEEGGRGSDPREQKRCSLVERMADRKGRAVAERPSTQPRRMSASGYWTDSGEGRSAGERQARGYRRARRPHEHAPARRRRARAANRRRPSARAHDEQACGRARVPEVRIRKATRESGRAGVIAGAALVGKIHPALLDREAPIPGSPSLAGQ